MSNWTDALFIAISLPIALVLIMVFVFAVGRVAFEIIKWMGLV